MTQRGERHSLAACFPRSAEGQEAVGDQPAHSRYDALPERRPVRLEQLSHAVDQEAERQ